MIDISPFTFRPGVVFIDDYKTEDEVFECLLPVRGRYTERWNGWECPFFPESEMPRVANRMASYPFYNRVTYYPKDDSWAFKMSDLMHSDLFDAVIIGGNKYYAVGAWCWCWQEAPSCAQCNKFLPMDMSPDFSYHVGCLGGEPINRNWLDQSWPMDQVQCPICSVDNTYDAYEIPRASDEFLEVEMIKWILSLCDSSYNCVECGRRTKFTLNKRPDGRRWWTIEANRY